MTEIAQAPDFALPLRYTTAFSPAISVYSTPVIVEDANGHTFAVVRDESSARLVVSAVNPSAAKDAEITRLREVLETNEAEIARLRKALETNGSMDFFRDGAKHMHDAIVSQKIHADWGKAATPDDGVTLALGFTKDLAAKTLAALTPDGKPPAPDPRDAEIARLRELLAKLADATDEETISRGAVEVSLEDHYRDRSAHRRLENAYLSAMFATSEAVRKARAALSSIPTASDTEGK